MISHISLITYFYLQMPILTIFIKLCLIIEVGTSYEKWLIMEGEVELGQIVDISDSMASFSEIENQSIVPESQAELSESK